MMVLLILLAAPASAVTVPVQPRPERHVYQLDFLIFEHVAEGVLTMEETGRPDVRYAELMGRTRGLASWLTGARVQRYRAVMTVQADGSLRSLRYESRISRRRFGQLKVDRRRFRFDQENRRILMETGRDREMMHVRTFEVPEGSWPVDMLTGFYNLRLGHYGPLLPGTRLEIPTVTSRGVSTIVVNVLTAEQRKRLDLATDEEGGLCLQVFLDPEIFETADGGLYLRLDAGGTPTWGRLVDVIGLGDVTGRLTDARQKKSW